MERKKPGIKKGGGKYDSDDDEEEADSMSQDLSDGAMSNQHNTIPPMNTGYPPQQQQYANRGYPNTNNAYNNYNSSNELPPMYMYNRGGGNIPGVNNMPGVGTMPGVNSIPGVNSMPGVIQAYGAPGSLSAPSAQQPPAMNMSVGSPGSIAMGAKLNQPMVGQSLPVMGTVNQSLAPQLPKPANIPIMSKKPGRKPNTAKIVKKAAKPGMNGQYMTPSYTPPQMPVVDAADLHNPIFKRNTQVYPTPTVSQTEHIISIHDSANIKNIIRILQSEPEDCLPGLFGRIENLFPLSNVSNDGTNFMGQSEIDINSSVAALRDEINPLVQQQIASQFENFLSTFKAATNTLAPPSLVWERNGSVVFTNPAFCHLTGFTSNMLPTKPNGIAQFFKMPDYWKFLRDVFNQPSWNETIIHVYLKSWRKETVYLEGSMCINMKRDLLGLPSLIFAHFLALPIKRDNTLEQ